MMKTNYVLMVVTARTITERDQSNCCKTVTNETLMGRCPLNYVVMMAVLANLALLTEQCCRNPWTTQRSFRDDWNRRMVAHVSIIRPLQTGFGQP